MKINDLTKETRRVPAGDLRANPLNWRHHPDDQRAAMAAVLEEVGFAGTVLAYEEADGGLTLIDGHMRVSLADDGELIPVTVLDLAADDPRIRKLLATYDPLTAMAEVESERLDELLASIEFDSEDIGRLIDEMTAPQAVVIQIPDEVQPGRVRKPSPADERPETPRIDPLYQVVVTGIGNVPLTRDQQAGLVLTLTGDGYQAKAVGS